MQLSVVVEFLLSGVLSATGLAALLEALQPHSILRFVQVLIDQRTRLPDGVIVTAGTVFLGLCYFIGILTSITIYDGLLRPKMKAIMEEVLGRSQVLTARASEMPHFPIYQDNLYDAVTVFIDVGAPEAVKRRRDFEGSLQRLARGSLPGLLLVCFAGIWRTVSARGLDFLQAVVLAVCGGLIWMAVGVLLRSMRDEAIYLAGTFAILTEAGQTLAPASPVGPTAGTKCATVKPIAR